MCIVLTLTNSHGLRLHLFKHDLKLNNNVTGRPLMSFPLRSFLIQQRMTFIYSQHQTIMYRASESSKEATYMGDILGRTDDVQEPVGFHWMTFFSIKGASHEVNTYKRGSLCSVPSFTSLNSTYKIVLLNYVILLNVQFTYAWIPTYLRGNSCHSWQQFLVTFFRINCDLVTILGEGNGGPN